MRVVESSPVQRVMIVSTIIKTHYHVLSSTMLKFIMIVDDSFCSLNEQMIVNDSFWVNSLAKTRLKLKWQMVK